MERLVYQSEHDFIHKLEELLKSGVKPEQIETRTPHPVHHAEEILKMKPSNVRLFVLLGGITGVATGYLFTSLTALDWTLYVGNKPLVGIPPYTVIAFELMVLFGGLSGFLGLLVTSRMPAVRTIASNDEFSDQFEIYVKKD
ncbi:MAG TPA: quinol:electron acceptor oxidoreductase subunit ActD [Candidatus Krumholzibacteria bacterium]|nr:quinol:electron acceptor oxidoreductase subunit ActD [Candidatus Krumholzibacteria bacterium]